jgi:hypothetical protein
MVMEVAALVGELAVAGRDRRSGSTTVVGAPLLAGQDLLGGGQLGGGDPLKVRVGHMLAVGGGGEAGDPDIDTDRGPGGFQEPGGNLVTGKDQHPAAALAANLDGLNSALDPAMHRDPHVTDPLQVHPAGVGLPSAAITILGPFDAFESVRRLEPRVAGRLADVHPPEEPGEGPVQSAQGCLLGRERPHRHIRPDLLELGRLIPIGDTDSPQPPCVASFLEGGIVQFVVRRQALPQGDVLAGGGSQPEPIRPPHSASHRRGMHRRAAAQKRASAIIEQIYSVGATCTAVRPPHTGAGQGRQTSRSDVMDETDLRLDGNAVAGMLAELFGFDMTVERGGCAACGATNQLGALLVYAHGMGMVACCPSCGQSLLRIGRGEGRWWLDLRGLAWLQLDEQARMTG